MSHFFVHYHLSLTCAVISFFFHYLSSVPLTYVSGTVANPPFILLLFFLQLFTPISIGVIVAHILSYFFLLLNAARVSSYHACIVNITVTCLLAAAVCLLTTLFIAVRRLLAAAVCLHTALFIAVRCLLAAAVCLHTTLFIVVKCLLAVAVCLHTTLFIVVKCLLAATVCLRTTLLIFV